MVFLALLFSASAVDPSCQPNYRCNANSDCHQMTPSNTPAGQSSGWVACINNACVVKTAGTSGGSCNNTVVCPSGTSCSGNPKICQAPKSPSCNCTSDSDCQGVCNNGVCASSNIVPIGGNCTRNSQDCVSTAYCNRTMQCQSYCSRTCATNEVCDSNSGSCIMSCDYGTYYNTTSKTCSNWKAQGATCLGNVGQECGPVLSCRSGVCSTAYTLTTLGQNCGIYISVFGASIFQQTSVCASGLFCSSNTTTCQIPYLSIGANCTDQGSCTGTGVCTSNYTHGMFAPPVTTCQPSSEGQDCNSNADCNNQQLNCKCTSTTTSVCQSAISSSALTSYTQLVQAEEGINACYFNTQLPAGCWASIQHLAQGSSSALASLSADCKVAVANLYCCIRCKDSYNTMASTWASLNSGEIRLSCKPPSLTAATAVCAPQFITPVTCGASTLLFAPLVLAAVLVKAFLW